MTKQALEEQEHKNKVRTEREFKGAIELFTSQDQLAGVSLNRSLTATPGVMANVAHVGIGGGAPRGERDGSGVSPNGSVLRRSQTSVPVYKKEAGKAKGGRPGDLGTREFHDFAGCVDAEVEHAAGSSDEEDGTGTVVAVADVYHNFEV
mmetsp:Transcript_28250/g.57934  ORF Transcript_28250/g.57934 Transcript_28250/m.57934 type:complete len:149 (-) Transcript_28250:60-506(-)